MNRQIEKQIREKQIRKQKKRILQRNTISTFIILIILISIILIIKLNKNDTQLRNNEATSLDYKEKNTLKVEITETNAPEIDSKATDWELILINKDNVLSEDYEVELENIGNGHKVDNRIANNLKQMLNDAKQNGLNPLVISSYRTHNTQQTLYKNKVTEFRNMGYSTSIAEEKASYWVAIPGTSEHEAGLALDIVASNYQKLNKEQENTPVQKWLMENCYKYGFILRYPTEKKDITKINYEPWHYRYVGIENATFMKEKGFCLEEYIDYLKSFDNLV